MTVAAPGVALASCTIPRVCGNTSDATCTSELAGGGPSLIECLTYRHSAVPEDWILLGAELRAEADVSITKLSGMPGRRWRCARSVC